MFKVVLWVVELEGVAGVLEESAASVFKLVHIRK
jgi:hypothetical protein